MATETGILESVSLKKDEKEDNTLLSEILEETVTELYVNKVKQLESGHKPLETSNQVAETVYTQLETGKPMTNESETFFEALLVPMVTSNTPESCVATETLYADKTNDDERNKPEEENIRNEVKYDIKETGESEVGLELSDSKLSSQKETLEKDQGDNDDVTNSQYANCEDIKEMTTGQNVTIVADFKKQDPSEKPRDFFKEETEDTIHDAKEASELCENKEDNNEQKPDECVMKIKQDEEIDENKPGVKIEENIAQNGLSHDITADVSISTQTKSQVDTTEHEEKGEGNECETVKVKENTEEIRSSIESTEETKQETLLNAVPVDVCISTQTEPKVEKNDEEAIESDDSQLKSGSLMVEKILEENVSEKSESKEGLKVHESSNEIASKYEDEDKERELDVSGNSQESGNEIISSQNASSEDKKEAGDRSVDSQEQSENGAEDNNDENPDDVDKTQLEEVHESISPGVEIEEKTEQNELLSDSTANAYIPPPQTESQVETTKHVKKDAEEDEKSDIPSFKEAIQETNSKKAEYEETEQDFSILEKDEDDEKFRSSIESPEETEKQPLITVIPTDICISTETKPGEETTENVEKNDEETIENDVGQTNVSEKAVLEEELKLTESFNEMVSKDEDQEKEQKLDVSENIQQGGNEITSSQNAFNEDTKETIDVISEENQKKESGDVSVDAHQLLTKANQQSENGAKENSEEKPVVKIEEKTEQNELLPDVTADACIPAQTKSQVQTIEHEKKDEEEAEKFDIPSFKDVSEETGSKKAEYEETEQKVSMLEKDEDDEKKQDVNTLEEDTEKIIPTDICVSTKTEPSEETTENVEKNVDEANETKSRSIVVEKIHEDSVSEGLKYPESSNEIGNKDEDQEKEQELNVSDKGECGGDEITSSQNAFDDIKETNAVILGENLKEEAEDRSIKAKEANILYEDGTNEQKPEESVNETAEPVSKVEPEKYTEEIKASAEPNEETSVCISTETKTREDATKDEPKEVETNGVREERSDDPLVTELCDETDLKEIVFEEKKNEKEILILSKDDDREKEQCKEEVTCSQNTTTVSEEDLQEKNHRVEGTEAEVVEAKESIKEGTTSDETPQKIEHVKKDEEEVEKLDIPSLKDVSEETGSKKAECEETEQKVSMVEKDEDDEKEQDVNTLVEDTEKIRSSIDTPEETEKQPLINVIPTDICVSTKTEPGEETTKNVEKNDEDANENDVGQTNKSGSLVVEKIHEDVVLEKAESEEGLKLTDNFNEIVSKDEDQEKEQQLNVSEIGQRDGEEITSSQNVSDDIQETNAVILDENPKEEAEERSIETEAEVVEAKESIKDDTKEARSSEEKAEKIDQPTDVYISTQTDIEEKNTIIEKAEHEEGVKSFDENEKEQKLSLSEKSQGGEDIVTNLKDASDKDTNETKIDQHVTTEAYFEEGQGLSAMPKEIFKEEAEDKSIEAQEVSEEKEEEAAKNEVKDNDGKENSNNFVVEEVCEETELKKAEIEENVNIFNSSNINLDEKTVEILSKDEEKEQELKDTTPVSEENLQETNYIRESNVREFVETRECIQKGIEKDDKEHQEVNEPIVINSKANEVEDTETKPEEKTTENKEKIIEEATENHDDQSKPEILLVEEVCEAASLEKVESEEAVKHSDSFSKTLDEDDIVNKDDEVEKDHDLKTSELRVGENDVISSQNVAIEEIKETEIGEHVTTEAYSEEEHGVIAAIEETIEDKSIDGQEANMLYEDGTSEQKPTVEPDENTEEVKASVDPNDEISVCIATQPETQEEVKEARSSDETTDKKEQPTDVYISTETEIEEKNDEEAVDQICAETVSEKTEPEKGLKSFDENEIVSKDEDEEKEQKLSLSEKSQDGEDIVTSSQNASDKDTNETTIGQHVATEAYFEEGHDLSAMPKEILKEEARDKSIEAQEVNEQYESGTLDKEQDPEESVDKFQQTCSKDEQDEYTEEIKPDVDANEEKEEVTKNEENNNKGKESSSNPVVEEVSKENELKNAEFVENLNTPDSSNIDPDEKAVAVLSKDEGKEQELKNVTPILEEDFQEKNYISESNVREFVETRECIQKDIEKDDEVQQKENEPIVVNSKENEVEDTDEIKSSVETNNTTETKPDEVTTEKEEKIVEEVTKNHDDQIKKSEILLVEEVCEATSSEKVKSDEAKQSDSFSNTLDEDDKVNKEGEVEKDHDLKTSELVGDESDVIRSQNVANEEIKETEIGEHVTTEAYPEEGHGVSATIEEIIKEETEDKSINGQEMSAEIEQSKQQFVEELRPSQTEIVSEKAKDEIPKKGEDLSCDKIEDTYGSTTTEEKIFSNSEKEKAESENLSTYNLESVSEVHVPEVVHTSEESKVNEEYLMSAREDILTVKEDTLTDEKTEQTTEIKQEIFKEACEDTNMEINQKVVTTFKDEDREKDQEVNISIKEQSNDEVTSSHDAAFKEDDLKKKSFEGEDTLVKTGENVDEDTEEINSNVETKDDESESSFFKKACEATSLEKAESEDVVNHSESSDTKLDENEIVIKEENQEKEPIATQEARGQCENGENDKSVQNDKEIVNEPVKDEVISTEDVSRETITVEPKEETKPSSSLEKSTEDISDSVKPKAESDNLPIDDIKSVSEVQVPEVAPKSEDSEIATYVDEEKGTTTAEISTDEISNSDPIFVEIPEVTEISQTAKDISCESKVQNESVDEASEEKSIPSLEDAATSEPQVDLSNIESTAYPTESEKLPTHALESICDVQTTEVLVDSEDSKVNEESIVLKTVDNTAETKIEDELKNISNENLSLTNDTSNSEKAKVENENLQIHNLESVVEVQVHEVVHTSEESKVNEEYQVSGTTLTVDEDKGAVKEDILTDEKSVQTTAIKQETFEEACEETNMEINDKTVTTFKDEDQEKDEDVNILIKGQGKDEVTSSHNAAIKEDLQENSYESEDALVKTGEKVDEDTEEINSNVETNDRESESSFFKEDVVKHSESSDTKLDENEIMSKEENQEKEPIDTQEARDQCENEENDKSEQNGEEIVYEPVKSCADNVEENITEEEANSGEEKLVKPKLDAENKVDRTDDISEIKDEVISTEIVSRETITAEPKEDIKPSSSLEKSTEDISDSIEPKAESDKLIDDIKSASEVQVSEVVPKSEDSEIATKVDEEKGTTTTEISTNENRELHGELNTASETMTENDQVNETTPQPEQSDVTSESIIYDHSLESKFEHTNEKDLEDVKKDIEEDVTHAPDNQIKDVDETEKTVILTDEVEVETEKNNESNEVKEQVYVNDHATKDEVDNALTSNQKESAYEIALSKPVPGENTEVTELQAESEIEPENKQVAEDISCLSDASSTIIEKVKDCNVQDVAVKDETTKENKSIKDDINEEIVCSKMTSAEDQVSQIERSSSISNELLETKVPVELEVVDPPTDVESPQLDTKQAPLEFVDQESQREQKKEADENIEAAISIDDVKSVTREDEVKSVNFEVPSVIDATADNSGYNKDPNNMTDDAYEVVEAVVKEDQPIKSTCDTIMKQEPVDVDSPVILDTATDIQQDRTKETSEVENLTGDKQTLQTKDQQVVKDDNDECEVKTDEENEGEVMVEASKDMEEVKTPKKSHNILSGVGSKVKHSLAKVKKAITGKSTHPKPPSPTKKDSVIT